MSWEILLKRDRVEHLRQLHLQFNADNRNLHGQPEDGGMNVPDDDLPEDVKNATEENIDKVIANIIADWQWMFKLNRARTYTNIDEAKEQLQQRKEIKQFIQDLKEI